MACLVFLFLAFANSSPLFNEVECLLATAKKYIGIREQGGNNRGPVVDKIIKEAGGKPGQAWCSFMMIYLWKQCNVPHRGTNGMAMSWAKKERLVPARKAVRATDIFTVYNRALGRIGHVGMVYRVFPEETFFTSFEGNVNMRGDRESVGSGAKCLMREYKVVNGIYRWTK